MVSAQFSSRRAATQPALTCTAWEDGRSLATRSNTDTGEVDGENPFQRAFVSFSVAAVKVALGCRRRSAQKYGRGMHASSS